jgi:hypothetical protein
MRELLGAEFQLASHARNVSTAAVNRIGVGVGIGVVVGIENCFLAQQAEHSNPIEISDADSDSDTDPDNAA